MKIIIGSESFAPNISGVATAVELLAKNLAKDGNEVYVFAPSRSYATHEDKKSFKDFTVIRFRSVPSPFRKGFRLTLWPKKEVYKFVEKIRPDIIHLHDPNSVSSSLLAASGKLNIPVVITNHFSLDYVISYLWYLRPVHKQVRRFLRKYLSNFYNKCEYITCPTKTVAKDLLTWGVKSPIVPISNGVDLDRFFSFSNIKDIYLKYHLPSNPIVLYAGRVDKDKQIQVFIESIPHVLKEVNAHFLIAGMGDEIPKMKKLAKKLEIEQEISWIGWIDRNTDELARIYQVADVFAIPSPIETQSIVTMEAMASGSPIVGANSGALPELIKNSKNGFLFKPGDSIDLAKNIVKILKDKKLQEKMSKASIEIVSEHQIEQSFKKIKEIYSKVLENQE